MFSDREVPIRVDVPVRREIVLGREVTVATVPDAGDAAPAPRGNPFGFKNTVSLAAGALYLRSHSSESDLVARSLNLGFCNTAKDTALSGGVSQEDLLRLLADANVASQAECGYSLEDLAQNIESGLKVIAFVNAGELWGYVDEPSVIEANYAVLMEGVARDAQSGEISGFFLRDPAAPEKAALVDASTIARIWLNAGGWQIVPSQLSP